MVDGMLEVVAVGGVVDAHVVVRGGAGGPYAYEALGVESSLLVGAGAEQLLDEFGFDHAVYVDLRCIVAH